MKKLIFLLLATLLFAVSKENILALSWENSFCKINPKDKACRLRKRGDYSLTHFVLHGLWPKHKNFCKTKYKFHLSPIMWRVLKKFMPAADYLAKHEWRKHGTCFGTPAETYFLTAIKLTQQFNETSFLPFVRMHMGQYLSLARIRYQFGAALGAGTQRKFQLICKRKDGNLYITEIRLNLKGDPTKEDLSKLIQNSKDMVGVKQCQGGIFAFP
ncbi:MAG: ribonuclease T [Epsilonproteobacteria bacterium]|nr:ribonuclease T [Campylobacterota bacterium]